MTAITHIQKTEPGPPRQIAVETPRIFPVPTRDAVETMSAWKGETAPSFCGFSITRRILSQNIRNCTKPVLQVKYSPAAVNTTTRMG